MLKHLHIRDFAVIEELELQFDAGMTVFTGETGAGKSIIVDALGLVLGDRAENTIIRSNCDRTEITAIFSTNNITGISGLLEAQDINLDDEVMLRRVINRDGPSRAYVNGSPVPAQFLRNIGEYLVDIHGQHEHQSLLKKEVQRDLLDEFGQHGKFLNTTKNAFDVWQAVTTELTKLSGSNEDRDSRVALLQYQIQELEALDPEPEKIAALEEEHVRLANANRLLESCQQSFNALAEEEHSISSRVNHHLNELKNLQKYDASLSSINTMLESAVIQINEATDELRHYLDNLEIDPARLKEVEEFISNLHDIARKHKSSPANLYSLLVDLKTELKNLQDSEHRYLQLQQARSAALEEFHDAATKLSEVRRKSARILSGSVMDKLHELGMPGGQFNIDIQELDKNKPQRHGMDRMEYQVAINPGQGFQPLHKVASGGELSRISLAIQVIASKDKGIPTLVFDEVDAGIGGGVAEIVGNLLHSLALKRQVFCVTHLPQVAAQADHHLLVNKSTHARTTLTQVINLNSEERIEEVARMLGGLNITEQTRAHAKEMLNN